MSWILRSSGTGVLGRQAEPAKTQNDDDLSFFNFQNSKRGQDGGAAVSTVCSRGFALGTPSHHPKTCKRAANRLIVGSKLALQEM